MLKRSFIIIIIVLIIILCVAYSYQEYIIYPGQLRKYNNTYEKFLNKHNPDYTLSGALMYAAENLKKDVDYPVPFDHSHINPEEITFKSDKGHHQTGYFVKPVYGTESTISKDLQNPEEEETEIWVVIGGNGSLALDWITDIGHLRSEEHHTSKHGHLLIEYPGYGKSKGCPSTETIFKVIQKSIYKILETHKNIKLNFICHSLGCASCLYYINQETDPNILSRIREIILLAPFYTLKDVAVSKYYIPRMFADTLIRHRWDSHKNIKSLDKLSKEASLKIIHGSNDELIDISQGLLLFQEAPHSINKEFIETNDNHNSIAHLKHLINHVPRVRKEQKTNHKKKKKSVRFSPDLEIRVF
jgi:uncharacterized alpha/beta hydrolase family protein